MGVRCRWLVLAALLVPAGTQASGHNWDVFFSPASIQKVNGSEESSVARSKRFGAEPSTDAVLYGSHFTVAGTTHFLPRKVSFVLDFSANFVELDSDGRRDLSQVTAMVGPRWTFRKGRAMPMVQVMPVGYTHNGGGRAIGVPDGAYAVAVGTGFEFVPAGANGQLGLRVQYDRFLFSRGKPQDRVSLGGILRFTEPLEERAKRKDERAAKKAEKAGSKKDHP
jgi:hypothetical protein